MRDKHLAYRLVIFDFDGTLADSADWFISMVNQVAEKFRFRKITEAEIEMFRGWSSREVVAYMKVPAWKMPFIARHTRKLVAENISEMSLFPGADQMLMSLADKGVMIALVSSNAEANVRKILGPTCADLVSYYACGASIFGKSPKFREVLRRTKVAKSDVISIGDETRDIEAAAEVGLASGAVTWGYTRPDILASHKPTYLLNTMEQIIETIAG